SIFLPYSGISLAIFLPLLNALPTSSACFKNGLATLPLIPSIILFSIGVISIGVLNLLVFSFIQKQVETAYIGRVFTLLTSASAFLGEAFTPGICCYNLLCFDDDPQYLLVKSFCVT